MYMEWLLAATLCLEYYVLCRMCVCVCSGNVQHALLAECTCSGDFSDFFVIRIL